MLWHMFSFCNHRCMFPSLVVSQHCWHWHRVLSCSFWEGNTVPLWHRIYHSNITECLWFSAHKLGRRQFYHPGGHTELLKFPVKPQWDCIPHVKPPRPSDFLQDKIWHRRPGCEARIFQCNSDTSVSNDPIQPFISFDSITVSYTHVNGGGQPLTCNFV